MKKIILLIIFLSYWVVNTIAQVDFSTQNTCIGDTSLFTINNTTGIDSVFWDFGDLTSTVDTSHTITQAKYKYTSPKTYSVKLYYYKTGIKDSLIKTIEIFNLPKVDLGKDQTTCKGSTLNLSTSTPFTSYFWNDSTTKPTLSVTTSGNYSVIATDQNKCSNSDTVKIIFTGPILNLDSLYEICQGADLTLDGGAGYSSYSWSNGSNTQTIQINSAGNYNLTVTDSNNCSTTASTIVEEVNGPLFSGYTQTPVSTIADGYAILNASGGTGDLIYSLLNTAPWQSSNQFSNLREGYYTAVVKDNNNCTDSLQIEILNKKDPVEPSDGFSPNQDGVNESWTINKIEIYPKAIVRVYNRWGKLVFESKGNYKPWNGTDFKGFVPSGTYFYFIDLQNGNKPQIGYITVIR